MKAAWLLAASGLALVVAGCALDNTSAEFVAPGKGPPLYHH